MHPEGMKNICGSNFIKFLYFLLIFDMTKTGERTDSSQVKSSVPNADLLQKICVSLRAAVEDAPPPYSRVRIRDENPQLHLCVVCACTYGKLFTNIFPDI